jgi:ABC-type phosphate/phosphonate transport system substrate-binding protein
MRQALYIVMMSAALLCGGCAKTWRGPALTLGICDPLARETASDCVRTSAVREFDGMVKRLSKRAGVTVRVVYFPFDAPLAGEMRAGRLDAALAKTWTVARAGGGWDRLADLLTVRGSGDLSGVFIARADSPLASVADLKGKKLLLGPDGAYEKSFAARLALHDADALPERVEIIDGCVPLAAEIIEKRADAGVVSSYVADFGGLSLLGDAAQFKEIGRTKSIPFMTFAVSTRLDPALRDSIRAALLEITGQDVPKDLYSTGFTAPAPWTPKEQAP